MRKIAVISIVLSLLIFNFSSLRAQSYYGRNANRPYAYIGVTFGGGLNTLLYSTPGGTTSPAFGTDLGAHYTHFFSSLGFGLGLHITSANATTVYNFDESTPGLTHADNPGAHYTLNTHYADWKERQHVVVLGIPVEGFFRAQMGGGRSLIAGVGVEVDMPMRGNYSGAGGSFTTTGVFPALGTYPVGDMPEHGFSTYEAVPDAKIEDLKIGLSVIADLGVRLSLGVSGGVYIGVYGSYGLTDLLGDQQQGGPLLTISPTNAKQIVYNGTFATGDVTGLHLLRVGVKVGIDLGSPMDI